MKIRTAAVAGSFYAGKQETLETEIKTCFKSPLGPGKIQAVNSKPLSKPTVLVVPHAGFMYSGPYAAHAYNRLASLGTPKHVVLIGPNHRGIGATLALDDHDGWETPLGVVKTHSDIRHCLASNLSSLQHDGTAHVREHSLEVQLPFLQFLFGSDFKITAIITKTRRYEQLAVLGRQLARCMRGENAVLLLSTDFNHFEGDKVSREKDKFAIDAIMAMNAEGLLDEVSNRNISMCGAGAVAIGIEFCKEHLAISGNIDTSVESKLPELLAYGNSGEITGDKRRVVGYGALELLT